jgi:beta-phosphoglucomutase-like phosphatase (HAD superfamily)
MKDEALKLALEALKEVAARTGARWALEQGYAGHWEAITAIKQALAAPTVQEPVAALIDENQRLRAELKFNTLPAQPSVHDLLEALKTLTNMAELFPDELHKDHPDVVAARAAIAKATGEKP